MPMLRTLSVLTVLASGVLSAAWAWAALEADLTPAPWLSAPVEEWRFGLQIAIGSARGLLAGCMICLLAGSVPRFHVRRLSEAASSRLDAVPAHSGATAA